LLLSRKSQKTINMAKANIILLVLSTTLPAIAVALQSLYVPPVTPQLYTRGPVNNSWKMMPDEPMPEVPLVTCLCFFVVLVLRCLTLLILLTALLIFLSSLALVSKSFDDWNTPFRSDDARLAAGFDG
jgi:hypothetical protein